MPSCSPRTLQLLDGGGTLQVGGDQHGLAAMLVAEQQRQLAGGGRFAAALQAAQHEDGRADPWRSGSGDRPAP